MEAQVQNNVKKNKQTNKQRKEKKKNPHMYMQTSITETLRKWRKIILKRKNLLWTGAPPNTQALSCRQKNYFLFLAGSFVINNITCNM